MTIARRLSLPAALFAAAMFAFSSQVPAGALVAVTSSVDGSGHLTVTGTDVAYGEDISVDCVGNSVMVNGNDPDSGPANCDSITAITVNAGGGGDTVYLYTDPAGWPLLGSPVVYGQGGGDTIYGGKTADKLHGGPGGDTIHGGDGNDQLFGDIGPDTLKGQAGNDALDGGGGSSDTCSGGPGHDTLKNCP
jgi:Ca2+-binding RTX toxin-like protein